MRAFVSSCFYSFWAMKRVSLLLFSFLTILNFDVSSQGIANESPVTIFDNLNQDKSGKGVVIINQPAALRGMVGVKLHGENVEKTDSTAYLKISGFRTQVFSGNNQRKSKDEAFQKEREIKELFPEVSTYVTYNAPFWRLRVGDFRSHEEAYQMLRMLMDAFPAYKKEMYIVKEEVRIPLN